MSPRLAEHSEVNEAQDTDTAKTEIAHIRMWRVDGETRLYVKSKAIEDFIKAIFDKANDRQHGIYKLIEATSLPPSAPYLGKFYPIKTIRLNSHNLIPQLSNGEFRDCTNGLHNAVNGTVNWSWLAAVGLSNGIEYRLSASPLKTSAIELIFDALNASITNTLAAQMKVNLESKILLREVQP